MNFIDRILFSANDPGGANAILPVIVLLKDRGDSVMGITTGPARDIFGAKGVDTLGGSSLSENVLRECIAHFEPSVYVAGTSIGESIDKKIFKMLREVPSVYVIDFWSHYGHRFSARESDLSHLPTRICVIDERMRDEMLQEGFPADRIVITGNPHFDHFTDGITRDHEDPSLAVFVSQPIRQDVRAEGSLDRGFDEYTVIESVIRVLPADMRLSIRLHPREERGKFDAYLNERITMSGEPTLETALSRAGLVVGMFSPVLMQAALASKPTISYQPGTTDDPLPTDALGITRKITIEIDLAACLAAYTHGEKIVSEHTRDDFLPTGATERVVAVVDELLSRQ